MPTIPIGVATPLTPPVVYGVVDLYGMAVKVTIVHNNNHSDRLRRNNAILRALSPEGALRRAAPATQAEPERLLFHPNCGQKAAITHEGRTALRPQYGPWGGEKPAEGALMELGEGVRKWEVEGVRSGASCTEKVGRLLQCEVYLVNLGQWVSGRHCWAKLWCSQSLSCGSESPLAVPLVLLMTSIMAWC